MIECPRPRKASFSLLSFCAMGGLAAWSGLVWFGSGRKRSLSWGGSWLSVAPHTATTTTKPRASSDPGVVFMAAPSYIITSAPPFLFLFCHSSFHYFISFTPYIWYYHTSFSFPVFTLSFFFILFLYTPFFYNYKRNLPSAETLFLSLFLFVIITCYYFLLFYTFIRAMGRGWCWRLCLIGRRELWDGKRGRG